jgi:Domain of unknown function (DUF1877)
VGIEASYRRINAAEWDRVQQLQQSNPALDGFDLYEAYATIADSDELRSSDRYLTIDKDWHALHVLLTGEISNPSNMKPFPPPLGNVVMGRRRSTPLTAKCDFSSPMRFVQSPMPSARSRWKICDHALIRSHSPKPRSTSIHDRAGGTANSWSRCSGATPIGRILPFMKKLHLIFAVLLMVVTALLVHGVPGVIHAAEKGLPGQSFVVKVSELIHENDIIVTQVEIEADPGTSVQVISDKSGRGGVTITTPEPTAVNRSARTRLTILGDHVVWDAGPTNLLKFMMKIKAGSASATMMTTGPMPKDKRLAETLSVLIEPGEYRYEAATRLVRFEDVTYSLVVKRPK